MTQRTSAMRETIPGGYPPEVSVVALPRLVVLTAVMLLVAITVASIACAASAIEGVSALHRIEIHAARGGTK